MKRIESKNIDISVNYDGMITLNFKNPDMGIIMAVSTLRKAIEEYYKDVEYIYAIKEKGEH